MELKLKNSLIKTEGYKGRPFLISGPAAPKLRTGDGKLYTIS